MTPNGRVGHGDVEPIASEQRVARPAGSAAEALIAKCHRALGVERDGDQICRLERGAQPLLRFAQRHLDAFPSRDVATRAHEPEWLARLRVADSAAVRLQPDVGAIRTPAAPGNHRGSLDAPRAFTAVDEQLLILRSGKIQRRPAAQLLGRRAEQRFERGRGICVAAVQGVRRDHVRRVLREQSIAFARVRQLSGPFLDATLELRVRRGQHCFGMFARRDVAEGDGNGVVRAHGGNRDPARVAAQFELDLVAIQLPALAQAGERL